MWLRLFGIFLCLAVGVPAARERLTVLGVQTKSHLEPFGRSADFLRAAVDFVLERQT